MDLTIPQIRILAKNLAKIKRAEAGEKEIEENKTEISDDNKTHLGPIIKMLTEKTGRLKFTMDEILNPSATILKYGGK
jgi:hypothetical protein